MGAPSAFGCSSRRGPTSQPRMRSGHKRRHRTTRWMADQALLIRADHLLVAVVCAPRLAQTGTSGLLLACQFDEVDTVGFLWPLQRRRYPATLRNAEGHTPLMVACIFGNATTAERLLRRGEEEEQDDQPSDPEESDEVHGRLLAHARTHAGWLLMLADKVSALSGFCSVPSSYVQCGKTALIHASMRGNLDCVRLLLSRGADLEHGDSDGDTPLIWAAWQGQTRCVEILLDAQPPAKIDHQDEVRAGRGEDACLPPGSTPCR